MAVLFVRNQATWNHTFHSWTGELGHWMIQQTTEVQVRAAAGAPSRTGATRASIRSSYGYSGDELQSAVGATTRQGLWAHEGTRPHVITPHNPNGKLAFYPTGSGRKVYAKVVKHPGGKGTPFLEDALKKVIGGISI